MADEETPVAEQASAEPGPQKVLSAYELMQATIDKYLSTASVNAVYSKPVRQGDAMVITAAETVCAFGFGMGEGSGQDGDQKGGGAGGGGGGKTFARPVAVVVCTPTGVSIQPILDHSKLWMAALMAAGFMLATLAKMRRPPRH